MCDQTQVSYLPGDVVWVKLSPLWWPGQIVAKNEIDENIIKNLKSLVAVVKFFEEDTYEFVKNLSNIYHYNCLRKVEFIKKGLHALRSGIKGSSSNVKRFPEDVIAAEVLTGGDPNILDDEIFQPEEKVDYKDLFPSASSKKTPKKPRLSETTVKQKESPYSTPSPAVRTITHPRFIKSNLGLQSNHDVKILIQKSRLSNDSSMAESSPTIYKCHACNFSTVRINVLILHNRSHWRNCDGGKIGKKKETSRSGPGNKNRSKIFSFVNQTPTGTKRKSETTGSLKKKLNSSADKTNRNSQTATTNRKLSDTSDNKAPNSDDNLHDSLLEDWMEYENLVEGDSKVDCAQIDDQSEKIANDDVKLKNKMSCFDFDETEDDSATMDSDSLYKRKIPRQIRERKLYSDVAECLPAVAATITVAATTDTAADDCHARNNNDRNKRIHENDSELKNASVDEKIINDLKRFGDEINVERINKFIDEVGSAAMKPINKHEKNEEPFVTTLHREDCCPDDSNSIENSVNHRTDNSRADDEDEMSCVNSGSSKYSSPNNTMRTIEINSENSEEENHDRSNKVTNSDTVKKPVSDENYALHQNGFVSNENVKDEYLPLNIVERPIELVSEDLTTVNNINIKGNANDEVVTISHPDENIPGRDFVSTENGECLPVSYAFNGIVLEQDLITENTTSITEYAENEIMITDDRPNEKVIVPQYDLINNEKTPNGVEKLTNNILNNIEERDSTATDLNSNLHAVADNVFAERCKFLSLGTNGPVDKSNFSSSVQEKIVSSNENCVREISEEFSVTIADNDKIDNNLKTAAGVVMTGESNNGVTASTDGSNGVTQVRNLDNNIVISNIAEVELRTMNSDQCVNMESERDHGEETIIIGSSDGINLKKNDNETSCELKNDNEQIKNHESVKTSSSCAIVIQSIRQLTVDTVGAKNKFDQRKMDGISLKERELTPCTNDTVSSDSTIRTNETIAGSAESFANEKKLTITMTTLCNAKVQLEAGINDFDDDDEDTQEDTNLLREEIDQLISQPESTLQDIDLHDDEAAAADGDEMRFEDFLKFDKNVRHSRDENKTEFKDFVESAEGVSSSSSSSIHRNIAYSNNIAGNYSGTIGEIIGPDRNIILEAAKLVGESATDVKMIALNDANNDDIGSAGFNIYTFADRKTGQPKQYILSEQEKVALLREQLASVNKLKVVTSNNVDSCTSSIETIVPPENSLFNLNLTRRQMKQTLINDADNSRQLYVASYEHVENPSNVHHRTISAENVTAPRVASENPIIIQYKSDHSDIDDGNAQSTSFAIISTSPAICRSYVTSLDGNNAVNNTNVIDNEPQNRQLQKLPLSLYKLIPAKLNEDVQVATTVNDAAAINVPTKQDILAKALECTDVLHPPNQIYNDLNYDGRTKSTNLTLKQTPIVSPAEKSSNTSCTFSSIEDFTWTTQH